MTFIEKNLHVRRPAQFEPELFRGQLYFICLNKIHASFSDNEIYFRI